MNPALLRAVIAFVVCFVAGTAMQRLMRLPTAETSRQVIPGLFTSFIVALYVFFVS